MTPTQKKGWKEDPGNCKSFGVTWGREGYGEDHLECHHTTDTGKEGIRPSQDRFRRGRSYART